VAFPVAFPMALPMPIEPVPIDPAAPSS
jgi:hypothetical protein